MADACVPSAVLGIPVIDADPVGRAVPEIVHSQFALHGLPIAPMALASEDGEATVIESVVDDAEAEVLVRASSDESGGAIWVADHALPWGELRDASIHGTLTLSDNLYVDSAAAAVTIAGGASVSSPNATIGMRPATAGKNEEILPHDRSCFSAPRLEAAGGDNG